MRIDPLMSPGQVAHHVHALHGGSSLAMGSTPSDLRNSKCTSCMVKQDRSAYWTPAMYFEHANGTTQVVNQVGGVLVYYLLLGDNIAAFPDNFQMLAGDTWNRNFSYPVPDPPKSNWNDDDRSQPALSQKALGFNCLNYNSAPEATLYRHFMPDKAYVDQNCVHGIRAEIMMPSCWNGRDSPDHRSHVAYPDLIIGGKCPKGFETRLPSLLYETIWDTQPFAGLPGQFMFSNGDPTGNGYHADFMNGWEPGLLQRAINTCTDPSGEIERCPLFDLQSEADMNACTVDVPDALAKEDTHGPCVGLPGDVEVQGGPQYATPRPHNFHPKSSSSSSSSSSTTPSPVSSSQPSLGYAPGTAYLTDNHGGVIPVAGVTETVEVPSPAQPTEAVEAAKTSSSQNYDNFNLAPTTVIVGQDNGVPISTSVFTDGATVYNVIIELVSKTVTVERRGHELATEPTPEPHRRHGRRHGRHRRSSGLN